MKTKILSNKDIFFSMSKSWNSLLNQSWDNSIFLSHEWFSCWLAAYTKSDSLQFLISKKGDRFMAAAPLIYSKRFLRRIPARVISFAENDEVPHCDFIIDKALDATETVYSFLTYILKNNLKKCDILLLRKILDNSQSIMGIKKFCEENNYYFLVRPVLASPVLELAGNWDVFYKSTSQRFKKRARYNRNKLKKLGNYSIEEVRDPLLVAQIMKEIIAVDTLSWKAEKGIGISSNSDTRQFFLQLPQSLSLTKGVSVRVLRLEEKILAYEYHIIDGDTVYALRAGFDGNAGKYAPGAVLDFHVVQELFQQKEIKFYNMCGSKDDYKRHWTSRTQDHFDIIIFNKTFSGCLLAILEKIIIPVCKKMNGRL